MNCSKNSLHSPPPPSPRLFIPSSIAWTRRDDYCDATPRTSMVSKLEPVYQSEFQLSISEGGKRGRTLLSIPHFSTSTIHRRNSSYLVVYPSMANSIASIVSYARPSFPSRLFFPSQHMPSPVPHVIYPQPSVTLYPNVSVESVRSESVLYCMVKSTHKAKRSGLSSSRISEAKKERSTSFWLWARVWRYQG